MLNSIKHPIAVAAITVGGLLGGQAPAREKPEDSNIVNNESATPTASLEKNVERLRRLSEGFLKWRDLTRDERSDPLFVATTLSRWSGFLEAAPDLTPEIVGHPRVAEVIFEALSEPFAPLPPVMMDTLIASEEFRAAALKLNSLRSSTTNVWQNLLHNDKGQELKRERNILDVRYSSMIRENAESDPEIRAAIAGLVPFCIEILPKTREAAQAVLRQPDTSAELFPAVRWLNVPEELLMQESVQFVKSAGPALEPFTKAIIAARITATSLESTKQADMFRELIAADTSMLEYCNDQLLASPQLAAVVMAEVRADPTFALELKPKLYETPVLKKELLAFFSEPAQMERYLESVQLLADLKDVPPLALDLPEIQIAVRYTCNKCIYRSGIPALPGVGIVVPDEVVGRIDEYAIRVPELLRVKLVVGALKDTRWATPLLMGINPLSFANLMLHESAPSTETIRAFEQTTQALRLLDIHGLNRFDNARAILRCRYAFAEPEVQSKLRTLLPDSFFKDVEQDSRPICIIVVAHPYADHNEVFSLFNDGYEHSDLVDSLTTHYRVLYYEATSGADVAREFLQLKEKYGLKAELALGLAHGSQDSMEFGAATLSSRDTQVMNALSGIMKPRATFALISCSTGASGEEKSMHRAFVDAFPECYVLAPDADTPTPHLELERDGKFRRLVYVGANAVVYDPTTRQIHEEPGLSRKEYESMRELGTGSFGSTLEKLGLLTVVFGIGAGVLAIYEGASARVVNARRKATQEGKHPKLFPTFWDRTWSRRFIRELVFPKPARQTSDTSK